MITGYQALTSSLAAEGAKFATEGAEASFSLVFLKNGQLEVDDLAAIKEAARLCDVVVVASLFKPLSEGQRQLAQAAGAAIFYMHAHYPKTDFSCQVRAQTGADITSFLEVILLVMPSVVVAHFEDLDIYRAVCSLEGQFQGLFNLQTTQTPVAVLDSMQQNLLELMQHAQMVIDQGERRIEVVLQYVLSILSQHGFKNVHQLSIFDARTLLEARHNVPQEGFLFVETEKDGVTLRRHLKIKI